MLAFFVFGNRCPVVREVASWAVVLLVSLVVQDSVFRGLLCSWGCFVAGFLPSLYLVQGPVVEGHAGGVFSLLCVWPSSRVTFCACLALWLDRDLSESNGVLCSVCSTCMFVLVCGWIWAFVSRVAVCLWACEEASYQSIPEVGMSRVSCHWFVGENLGESRVVVDDFPVLL